jgi:calcium channel MID1
MPGNDDLNSTELVRVYDNYARDMYENFKKVLAQIPCEAPPDQRYSLARNCSDCETAYKRWLCTVSIPRCEDVSSTNPFAVLRNANDPFPNGTTLPDDIRQTLGNNIYFNTSRNRQLNDEIKPGPYKEILPCDDICYEVVQSCPAAMQFACPRPGWIGFNISYAERGDPGDDQVRCSFPGQSRTRTGVAAGMLSPAPYLIGILPMAALFALLV